MAQPAYNLEHFAPQPKTAPKSAPPPVKAAPKPKTARRSQALRMVRMMLGVAVVLALVSGVLHTQVTLAELQDQILSNEQQLAEELSYNAYLTFELDNITSIKNIEESAASMGLGNIESNQIEYFRTEEGNNIVVRQSPLSQFFASVGTGLEQFFAKIFGL